MDKIRQLEEIIAQQNNLIESRGYYLHREAIQHLEPEDKVRRAHILQLEKLEDQDRVPSKVKAFMEEKDDMLK